MEKEAFLRLTEKVSDGTATDAELALYNQYFNHFQTNQVWDEQLMGEEDSRGQLLFESIDRAIASAVPVKNIRQNWKRIVAAAAVLILVTGIALLINKRARVSQPLVSQSNLALSKTNNLIQLPDGSTAILSAGSKLSYAQSFEGKPVREVFLTGKAFFDIKHDHDRPFIVRAGKVNTKVLGTAFDVDSRAGKVTVTVIRGKVVVDKEGKTLGTLTPNKQVIYDSRSNQATLKDTNAAHTTSWKEDDLIFKDITFNNAALLLQERFGVKVIVTDEELAQQRFTTTLFEKQPLADFLALICDFNHAAYTYDTITKQITIKPKN